MIRIEQSACPALNLPSEKIDFVGFVALFCFWVFLFLNVDFQVSFVSWRRAVCFNLDLQYTALEEDKSEVCVRKGDGWMDMHHLCIQISPSGKALTWEKNSL